MRLTWRAALLAALALAACASPPAPARSMLDAMERAYEQCRALGLSHEEALDCD